MKLFNPIPDRSSCVKSSQVAQCELMRLKFWADASKIFSLRVKLEVVFVCLSRSDQEGSKIQFANSIFKFDLRLGKPAELVAPGILGHH